MNNVLSFGFHERTEHIVINNREGIEKTDNSGIFRYPCVYIGTLSQCNAYIRAAKQAAEDAGFESPGLSIHPDTGEVEIY